MDKPELPDKTMKFLQESMRLAQSRIRAEHMVRSQLAAVPTEEDFIVAAQKFAIDPATFNVVELRKTLIETAIPRSWIDISNLYTGHQIGDPCAVSLNAVVYPVIRVSEYDAVKDYEPRFIWHRGKEQTVTRKWTVSPQHTHMLSHDIVFIELRQPMEEQETVMDGVEYHACIVGFCVEIKDLQIVVETDTV